MDNETIVITREEYNELLEAMKRAEFSLRKLISINEPAAGDSPGIAGYYLRCPNRPIFEGVINGIDELCRQTEKLIARS